MCKFIPLGVETAAQGFLGIISLCKFTLLGLETYITNKKLPDYDLV